jgi:hypothetical protein
MEPLQPPRSRGPRRKLLAALATLSGIVMLALEFIRPHGSAGERWFWLVVGVLLIALGVAELLLKESRDD